MLFAIFLFIVPGALLTAHAARERGRRGSVWGIVALVTTPPVALLGLLALPSLPNEASTRVCPHCQSRIHRGASRCPHCTGEIAE